MLTSVFSTKRNLTSGILSGQANRVHGGSFGLLFSKFFSSSVAAAATTTEEVHMDTVSSSMDTLSGSRLFGFVKEYEDYRRALYGGLTHKALLVDAVGTLVLPSQPMAQVCFSSCLHGIICRCMSKSGYSVLFDGKSSATFRKCSFCSFYFILF